MNASYDSYLVPRLADLAKLLKPYVNTGDFSVHKVILDTAFDQVVKEGGIRFQFDVQEIRFNLLCAIVESSRFTYGQIDEWFGGKDFQWLLYDKCYQAHESGAVKFTNFDYSPKPRCPEMVKKDLDLLTVNDIKEILKKNGHSTTGKRNELVDRLWQFFPINDTEAMLSKRYQEKLEKYMKSQLKRKYEMLASHILQRAFFLRKIATPSPFRFYKPKLSLSMCEKDDKKLAEIIDGTGYDDVVLSNKINKLLPLFPRDFSNIEFDYKF